MKRFIEQEYTGPLTRDEIEYWILDTAVLEHQPLSFLLASNADELLNKPLRLGPREELWQIFEAMLRRGDVELVEFVYSSARRKWRLAPFEKGKLGYRELPRDIQYRLTRRGGWRWEVASKPRWDEFARLAPYRIRDGVQVGYAFAASREAIEVYLRRNGFFYCTRLRCTGSRCGLSPLLIGKRCLKDIALLLDKSKFVIGHAIPVNAGSLRRRHMENGIRIPISG